MNLMAEVAELLQVELDKPFKIDMAHEDHNYVLRSNGLFNISLGDYSVPFVLNELLNGSIHVKRASASEPPTEHASSSE